MFEQMCHGKSVFPEKNWYRFIAWSFIVSTFLSDFAQSCKLNWAYYFLNSLDQVLQRQGQNITKFFNKLVNENYKTEELTL